MARDDRDSLSARLAAFRRVTVEHPLFVNAVETMFMQTVDFDDPPIILLVGPAGSGKTRALRFNLPHRLLGSRATESRDLTPYRAYVYTELPSVDHLGFRWKDYYERALLKLNEPAVNSNRRPEASELERAMNSVPEGSRMRGSAVARLQLETAMRERKVHWWVMDNAAALLYAASASSYMSQLNTVMSLANMTGAAIIVCATYEILGLFDLNGQLDRRVIDVELPRYNHEKNSQDGDSFCSAILEHIELSPIPLQGSPEKYLSMFYEGSLGLYGCWKVWFDRALCAAIHQKSKTITMKHLRRWGYSAGALKAMHAEMIEGETLYAAFKENREEVDGEKKGRQQPQQKRLNHKPGKRNAHHDLVDEAV